MKEKKENRSVLYLLVSLNIILQLILFGKYINGDVMSILIPHFGDSKEYVNTTEHWIKSYDFVSTFISGWRLPGYSSFMLIIYKLADWWNCKPLILLRVVQLLFSAFIPFFSYKTILNFSKSEKTALLGSLVICIYYPFYYFTTLISAESISLFFISILMYQLSTITNKEPSVKNVFFIALNIAVLTYLKPNHILFSIPSGILLINNNQFFSREIFRSIIKPLILATFIIVLLLPWVIFISAQNKMFIPLATTSGIDMVIGTGIPINDQNRDSASLTFKYEEKQNFWADTILLNKKKGLSAAQMNKAYQSEAVSIWKKRPWITFKYGLVKVAHSAGFGFRGPKDYFSFLIIIPALLILLFSNQFKRKYKNLSTLVAILMLLFCIQSFVYFGDMRLRILMIDMPLVYTIAVFLCDLYKKLAIAFFDFDDRDN